MDEYTKQFRKFSLAFLLFFTLSGCTTLDLNVPMSDLESPQHQGKASGFGVEFSGQSAQQIKLVEDPSKRPLNITGSQTNEDIFVTKTGLNIYLWNRVTTSLGLLDSKTPFWKTKVSLLSGYREDAEPGRYHMSLSTEISYQRAESSGTQNGIAGPSGYPWKGTSEILNGKVGLSLGYQFWKKLVPFIGVNYQQIQTVGKIEQTPAGSDAGGVYKIQPEIGKIIVTGIGLDWKPSHRFYIVPQVLYYNFKWYDKNFNQIGGSLRLVYVPIQ